MSRDNLQLGGFGQGLSQGLSSGMLMNRMMQVPGESTGEAGKRKLGILSGAGTGPSPLMRRLMDIAKIADMEKMPSPKNNWGLNQLNSAFGTPVQGGTGIWDTVGGWFGQSTPSAGGGTGMAGPSMEGDMYSTGGSLGLGAGSIGGGMAGGMGADMAMWGYM